MKYVGIVLLLVGSLCAVLAWNLDPSVSSPFGIINNFGLMQEKQNYLLISGLTILIGVILFGFGAVREATAYQGSEKCPFCGASVRIDAKACPYCHRILPVPQQYAGLGATDGLRSAPEVPYSQHSNADSQSDAALGTTEKRARECPYCAEVIRASARRCKHCQSEVTPIPEVETPPAASQLAERVTDRPIDPYVRPSSAPKQSHSAGVVVALILLLVNGLYALNVWVESDRGLLDDREQSVSAEAAATSSASLCSSDEVVIFSCSTGKKTISYCGSNDLGDTGDTGYMQYRFGSKERLELVWPEAKVPPEGNFELSYLRPRNDDGSRIDALDIVFSPGVTFEFRLYYSGDRWAGGAVPQGALTVKRDNKELAEYKCRPDSIETNTQLWWDLGSRIGNAPAS